MSNPASWTVGVHSEDGESGEVLVTVGDNSVLLDPVSAIFMAQQILMVADRINQDNAKDAS